MPRPPRLPNHHYGAGARYSVTFRTHHRRPVLSRVRSDFVVLTPLGELLSSEWAALPERYRGIFVDEKVVMPDHFHGILRFGADATSSLSQVTCRLKGRTTIRGRRTGLWGPEPLWQRSFYDLLIWCEKQLFQTRDCIRRNPARYSSSGWAT